MLGDEDLDFLKRTMSKDYNSFVTGGVPLELASPTKKGTPELELQTKEGMIGTMMKLIAFITSPSKWISLCSSSSTEQSDQQSGFSG